jgi:hypothetical protein
MNDPQHPLRAAPTSSTREPQSKNRRVKKLNNDHTAGTPASHQNQPVKPVALLQVLPDTKISTQTERTQKTCRQGDPAPGVRAQRALHSQQTGVGTRPRRKGDGQRLQKTKGELAILFTPGGSRAAADPAARTRLRDNHGVSSGLRTRGTDISQPPRTPIRTTGKDQTDRAGAAPVPRMPATPMLLALTGPQIRGHALAAGVTGQVDQRGRPSRRSLKDPRVRHAPGTRQQRPDATTTQLDHPQPLRHASCRPENPHR